jgi:antitoxin (DNA-binding transcriptional repressor) of toxin-antitoxin stability system
MLEITATDLRKDLFKVLDRLSRGEEIRVRRRGQVLTLTAIQAPEDRLTEHHRKFQAALSSGVREDWADYDPGDITDGRHFEWTPEDN